MGELFKNVLEPLFLILAFTAGCLINRRRYRPRKLRIDDDLESTDRESFDSPNLKPTIIHLEFQRRSPNILFSLLSRFFNSFPFFVEVWYWNLTYWVYQLLRAWSAKTIAGNEFIFARAEGHALQLLSIETSIGIAIEQRFQVAVMTRYPQLMPLLASIYYSHITVGVCFIVYTYTCMPPSTFQRIRRTIAMDNAIAFVIITWWRCYPPRLLPPEYGFVDVLHSKQSMGNAWTHNSFQLTIAAMPSLHFGTSLFFAVCLNRFSPHRWVRILAPLWPAAMIVTIVATANHFLLDAAVGAIIPFIGWRTNHILLGLKPLQDWAFSPLTRRMDLIDCSYDDIQIEKQAED